MKHEKVVPISGSRSIILTCIIIREGAKSRSRPSQHHRVSSSAIEMTPFAYAVLRSESRPQEIRGQGFELIALFSNVTHWRDMYDEVRTRILSVPSSVA